MQTRWQPLPGVLLLALGLLPTVWGAPTPPPSAGGVRWIAPEGWVAQPARMMRVATYTVPGAPGSDGAECAVFYFGSGQGGDIDDNIRRWASQFEAAPAPERGRQLVLGLTVHTVTVSGTFLAPSGPMMASSGRKHGWRLLGAIVEAPEGNVFLKLTGPATTVAGASTAFDAMVASVRKDP